MEIKCVCVNVYSDLTYIPQDIITTIKQKFSTDTNVDIETIVVKTIFIPIHLLSSVDNIEYLVTSNLDEEDARALLSIDNMKYTTIFNVTNGHDIESGVYDIYTQKYEFQYTEEICKSEDYFMKTFGDKNVFIVKDFECECRMDLDTPINELCDNLGLSVRIVKQEELNELKLNTNDIVFVSSEINQNIIHDLYLKSSVYVVHIDVFSTINKLSHMDKYIKHMQRMFNGCGTIKVESRKIETK